MLFGADSKRGLSCSLAVGNSEASDESKSASTLFLPTLNVSVAFWALSAVVKTDFRGKAMLCRFDGSSLLLL